MENKHELNSSKSPRYVQASVIAIKSNSMVKTIIFFAIFIPITLGGGFLNRYVFNTPFRLNQLIFIMSIIMSSCLLLAVLSTIVRLSITPTNLLEYDGIQLIYNKTRRKAIKISFESIINMDTKGRADKPEGILIINIKNSKPIKIHNIKNLLLVIPVLDELLLTHKNKTMAEQLPLLE